MNRYSFGKTLNCEYNKMTEQHITPEDLAKLQQNINDYLSQYTIYCPIACRKEIEPEEDEYEDDEAPFSPLEARIQHFYMMLKGAEGANIEIADIIGHFEDVFNDTIYVMEDDDCDSSK